ncbi:LIM-domain binding protein-domain-containing protein [Aspergillus coremiiformis]|uniref:LIM-domain binding protein-domain-containing protein n=1 Tax=Aspergillus coremiiformis TaxID=138285 RepID=A0A5N6Z7T7_9EURO|nr:LIM-domain binding protein-domain-containing protein [Aspergillus coremiiformis]
MMMAQPFPAHQGIPQHPGIPPGHPLAPGQHPNAHPGAGMVQQVHPGVSAPGGPQVTQGGPMMGGMPPGAGTTAPGPVQAHALSHLGPAQAHLFQQPHFAQNYANNPQLLHQQHQQNLLRQRMMFQQQQQQQQQQHGGIPVSMPNGSQGLSAAQIAAMQNPGMRPVISQMQLQQMPHGQQQIQQQHFLAMQAQQAHQAQQAQQAHQAQQAQQAQQGHQAQQVQQPTTQPGQQTPQQRPAPHPQSVHDAQSVTPQPQHIPPPHRGSATPQPNPQQPPVSQPPQQPVIPQPQPTPNPPPQQLPQTQQPVQPQPPQQPQQQPPQPQQPQPQPQPQPQQGQQGPQQGQQQGQQPGQQQQQGPLITNQEAQLKAQQQQNAMLMQQRMNMKGATILCLNTFAEHLSNFASKGEAHDLLYWQSFVDKFYSPSGVLRQGVWNPQTGSKQFEIATPALARYYLTQFTSGIRHIQMVVENARERDSPNGGHIVESAKTSFIYWFTNDTQIFTNGKLRAQFDMNNKIEILDIDVSSYTEYLPRSQLHPLEITDQKQSPKVSKNMGKRKQAQQAQPQPQPQLYFALPESMVTPNGVPTAVMSFLEVAETISQMQVLFQYSQQNPQLSAPEALRNLVNTFQAQTPTPGYMPAPMNPAMQPGQNPRVPNLNGPNQFASPGMAHLGLPGVQGSPHLSGSAHPSPAQSHLAGPPGMVPQGQVQPNIGQGTSASASPNVSHKRRRASAVKMENDDGGAPEINGTAPPGPKTVKASPRVGGKRQKGTA